MKLINGIRIVGSEYHYYLDAKEVTKRQYYARFARQEEERRDIPAASCDWKKPILSDALSVHPEQIKDAIEDAQKRGVSIEFAEDGRAIFRSRQQRSEYCKAYGFCDLDAGYGDVAPGTNRDQEPHEVKLWDGRV